MAEVAIGEAVEGLRKASELASSLLTIDDAAALQAKVVELQSVILATATSIIAAQGEQIEQARVRRSLEARIAALEESRLGKDRYELKEIATHTFVYSLRADRLDEEPHHYLCAGCFTQGEKSILQRKFAEVGRRTYLRCSICAEEALIEGDGAPALRSQPYQQSQVSRSIATMVPSQLKTRDYGDSG